VSAVLLHPVIRPLQPEDLAAVEAIEQASYPFPWTLGIFTDCLKAAYACFGLFGDGGLCAYSVHNGAAGEAHLLSLCVAPEMRRRGLGRLLLDHAIRHARRQGCRLMYLEVRPSNPEALSLYRRRGFQPIGQRPGYYPAHEGREDAVVMCLELADT